MARTPLLRWLLALVLSCLGVAPLCAAPGLGLQMSLVTGVSRFEYPPDVPQTAAHRRAARQESFTASASLTNLSRSAVTITYPDANAAAARFSFKLIDGAGATVWTSDTPSAGTAADVPFTLRPKGVLRKSIQVPLKTRTGEWLPAGHYTLRAETGERGALAAVPLEVVGDPLPAGTGIEGQVFFQGLPQIIGVSANVVSVTSRSVPIQATVSITEVRDPNMHTNRPAFTWTGPTDSDGRFHVETPAGKFVLSASNPDIIEPNYLLPHISKVSVVAGQFTTSNFTIIGRRRDPGVAIFRVDSATVERKGTDPTPNAEGLSPVPTIVIKAYGTASTTGWTEPRLVQRPGSPAGVIDFDFIALPPNGASGQAFVPIQTELTLLNDGGALPTIRIHSSTNSVVAKEVREAH